MEENIEKLLKENNDLLKEQNDLLRQMYAFWTKIVSEEYFNEMMQEDMKKDPKLSRFPK